MAAVAAGTAVFGWRTQGSLAGPDWLPFAILVALIGATAAAAGAGVRPPRSVLVGAGALFALAAWTGASIAWAPSGARARDEALLTLFYALVLALPGFTLVGERARAAALGAVVFALGALGIAAAVRLATARSPAGLFYGGRLDFPISYVNADSALFVLGVWPAVVLAARRAASAATRCSSLAAASLFLALAVSAQSRGTILGFALSCVLIFALAPARLRLLPPLLIAAAPAAAAAAPLTAPYRGGLAAAQRDVGTWALAVGAAGFVLGALYTVADRRLELGERRRRLIGRAALALAVVCLLAAVTAFVVSVPSPSAWASQKWAAFKRGETRGGSTRVVTLGSNRYDFWRVALDEAAAHPALGIGGRGFYSAYLEHRRTHETPLRAHSLYLDAVAEEGVPGLVLLLVGLGAPLLFVARRLRSPSAAAAFGAGTYFAGHAAVDWIWTVPSVGTVALLLLGIGAAGDERIPVRGARSFVIALAAAAVAVFAFAPPWLAYRYVAAAYHSAQPTVDLARARQLDPLSLDPDWAEWRLAADARGRIAALERARAQEPDAVAVLYQLGLEYMQTGQRAAARSVLLAARRLDPREDDIRAALERLRR